VYCAQQRYILCIANDNAIVLFGTTPNCDVLYRPTLGVLYGTTVNMGVLLRTTP
jgi:hypothetical protein